MARPGVRGTFSLSGPSRPTVAPRLAPTLGVAIQECSFATSVAKFRTRRAIKKSVTSVSGASLQLEEDTNAFIVQRRSGFSLSDTQPSQRFSVASALECILRRLQRYGCSKNRARNPGLYGVSGAHDFIASRKEGKVCPAAMHRFPKGCRPWFQASQVLRAEKRDA